MSLFEMDVLELGDRAATWLYVAADNPEFMLAHLKVKSRKRVTW